MKSESSFKMITKTNQNFHCAECLHIANELQGTLQPESRPEIVCLLQLSANFFWNLVRKLFQGSTLIPSLDEFDCLNEIEEFQLILLLLEQILQVDLTEINPASLHLRQPRKLRFLLQTIQICATQLNRRGQDTQAQDRKTDDEHEEVDGKKVDDDDRPHSGCFASFDSFDQTDSSGKQDEIKKPDKPEAVQDGENSAARPTKTCENQFSRKPLATQLTPPIDQPVEKRTSSRSDLLQELIQLRQTSFSMQISNRIIDILDIDDKTAQLKKNMSRLFESDRKRPVCNKKRKTCFKKNPKKWNSTTTTSAMTSSRLAASLTIHNHPKQTAEIQINQSVRKQVRLNSTKKKKTRNEHKSFDTLLSESLALKQVHSGPTGEEPKLDDNPEIDLLIESLTGLSVDTVRQMRADRKRSATMQASVEQDRKRMETHLRRQVECQRNQELQRLELTVRQQNQQRRAMAERQQRLKPIEMRSQTRQMRTERALLYKRMEELHRNRLSRLMKLEAEQEQLIKQQFDRRTKEVREQFLEMKQQLRETKCRQARLQSNAWQSFGHLYDSQLAFFDDKLKK